MPINTQRSLTAPRPSETIPQPVRGAIGLNRPNPSPFTPHLQSPRVFPCPDPSAGRIHVPTWLRPPPCGTSAGTQFARASLTCQIVLPQPGPRVNPEDINGTSPAASHFANSALSSTSHPEKLDRMRVVAGRFSNSPPCAEWHRSSCPVPLPSLPERKACDRTGISRDLSSSGTPPLDRRSRPRVES